MLINTCSFNNVTKPFDLIKQKKNPLYTLLIFNWQPSFHFHNKLRSYYPGFAPFVLIELYTLYTLQVHFPSHCPRDLCIIFQLILCPSGVGRHMLICIWVPIEQILTGLVIYNQMQNQMLSSVWRDFVGNYLLEVGISPINTKTNLFENVGRKSNNKPFIRRYVFIILLT